MWTFGINPNAFYFKRKAKSFLVFFLWLPLLWRKKNFVYFSIIQKDLISYNTDLLFKKRVSVSEMPDFSYIVLSRESLGAWARGSQLFFSSSTEAKCVFAILVWYQFICSFYEAISSIFFNTYYNFLLKRGAAVLTCLECYLKPLGKLSM